MAEFKNRVREHRAIVGRGELTQQVLADRAGISVTTLSEIENGKVAPSMKTAQALAGALGVSLDDLFAPAVVSSSPTEQPDSGVVSADEATDDRTPALMASEAGTPPSDRPTASPSIEGDRTAAAAPVGNR